MVRTAKRLLPGALKWAWLLLFAVTLLPGAARADYPRPWQMDFQEGVTPVAIELGHFWHMLLFIITGIMVFVLILMAYIALRFRASVNPTPTTTTHNTTLEVVWTIVPVFILLFIAVPSFKSLYFQEIVPPSPITLKVTANQWYWHYDYPDNGNFGFDSYVIDPKDLKPGEKRLLDVDNEVVLPVNTNVRVIIAGNDVMHSFFVPSLGIQKYAVPGHLNEVWINIVKPGVYYGECNQICGVNHAYMPIRVHAVSAAEFAAWVTQAQKKFASEDNTPPPVKVAAVPKQNVLVADAGSARP